MASKKDAERLLGTGMARKAAGLFKGRARSIDEQIEAGMGKQAKKAPTRSKPKR